MISCRDRHHNYEENQENKNLEYPQHKSIITVSGLRNKVAVLKIFYVFLLLGKKSGRKKKNTVGDLRIAFHPLLHHHSFIFFHRDGIDEWRRMVGVK